jgi:hypothetical protein
MAGGGDTSMFHARLTGLPTAALLPLAVASMTPALGSDRVDARFEVFGFAGLHLLTNRTSAEETTNGYTIATTLDTRGIASAFVDLRGHSEVQGVLRDKVPHPQTYHSEIWRNGSDRHYALRYSDDGNVVGTAVLPSTEGVHLDPALVRGTVDQLTAYFLLERQLSRVGSCGLVVPVFDGNELYRLRFSDVREDTLSADNYQDFVGPTHVCKVVREMIVANPDKKEGTYKQGMLWYARLLPNDRMVPVRMEYDTLFGKVAGYLAELIGYGIHLHLMEE